MRRGCVGRRRTVFPVGLRELEFLRNDNLFIKPIISMGCPGWIPVASHFFVLAAGTCREYCGPCDTIFLKAYTNTININQSINQSIKPQWKTSRKLGRKRH